MEVKRIRMWGRRKRIHQIGSFNTRRLKADRHPCGWRTRKGGTHDM
jgi:hypothetical protein